MLWWSWRYAPRTHWCTWTLIICEQKMQHCHQLASRVSYSYTCTQYQLDSLLGKVDWQISGAGSVRMWIKTYANSSPVHLNFDQIAAKAAALPGISKPVSYILTQLFNLALTYLVPKMHCQICSAQLSKRDSWHTARILQCAWRWLTCALVTLVTSKWVCCVRCLVHHESTTDEWFNALHCIILRIRLMPFIMR